MHIKAAAIVPASHWPIYVTGVTRYPNTGIDE